MKALKYIGGYFMKKILLSILTLLIALGLSFGDLSTANANNKNEGLNKPESNVDQKTKDKYIKLIKNSDEYKKYAKKTDISKIKKENIVVENNKSEDGKKMFILFPLFLEKIYLKQIIT